MKNRQKYNSLKISRLRKHDDLGSCQEIGRKLLRLLLNGKAIWPLSRRDCGPFSARLDSYRASDGSRRAQNGVKTVRKSVFTDRPTEFWKRKY